MAATVAQAPVQRRTPRWVLVILVLSLLLNGLVIGGMASGRWALQAASPWLGSSVNAHLVGFAITLPAERRRAIWQATEPERARMRPLRKTIREARATARAALLADPFDPARFTAAQTNLLSAETEARKTAQSLILSIASRLTPEERAAFARWEAEDGKRRSHFWKRLRDRDREEGPALDGPMPERRP